MASEVVPVNALLVIVDADADAWSPLDCAAAAAAPAQERKVSFPEFVACVHACVGAFLAQSRRNVLGVWAHNGRCGGYAWPTPVAEHPGDLTRISTVNRAVGYALRRLRNDTRVREGVRPVGAEAAADAHAHGDDALSPRHRSLASCLSAAMCFHQRAVREHKHVRTRVLVLQCGVDDPPQYIPIMNAAFSAHRLGITLDTVMLGERPSTYLQQASFLTKGIATHPRKDEHGALFEFLVTTYLADAALRKSLLLPPQHSVDLRATCFCHKQHQSIAWVCTICLSVFCAFAPVCTTCGARAPEAPPQLPGNAAPGPASTPPAPPVRGLPGLAETM